MPLAKKCARFREEWGDVVGGCIGWVVQVCVCVCVCECVCVLLVVGSGGEDAWMCEGGTVRGMPTG